MIGRISLFVAMVGAMFLFGVSVHAQIILRPTAPPPPVVIEETPPAVIVPSEPRCRTVRETKHDDILDTNDYTEHEECD